MKKWLEKVGVALAVSCLWGVVTTSAWAQAGGGAPGPSPQAPAPAPQGPPPGAGAAPPAATSPNYVLGPNDRIGIRAVGLDDVSGQFNLNADGTFNYAYLGEIKASGRTVSDLEGYLRKELIDKGIYRNPQISISVLEYRSKMVHVIGAVARPSQVALIKDMGILDAIVAAGGMTANASDFVWLIRPEGETSGPVRPGEGKGSETRIDLAPLRSGQRSTAMLLNDGDTLVVEAFGRVTISGEVRSPNQYEVRRDTTVREALTLAGGVAEFGAQNRIEIIREENGKKRTIKDVKMEDLVMPGDTIVVPRRRL